MSEENKDKKSIINEETIIKMLDTLYQKSTDGIQYVSPPVEKLAQDYLKRYPNPAEAAKAMLKNQIAKCTTSGVITGFGGLITLPITVPANISSVLYIQMRMIACTAYLGGYDLTSDQVQTFVYACLAGVSVNSVTKKFGAKVGEKFAVKAIEKIPRKTLTKINQKVGFRFITKFGETGLINLGKMVPGVGTVINGVFDYAETKVIAKRAYKMFIMGDFSDDEEIQRGEQIAEDLDAGQQEMIEAEVFEVEEKSKKKKNTLKEAFTVFRKDPKAETEYVYVSKKGKCYHLKEKEAGNASVRMTRGEAEQAGYRPCSRCALEYCNCRIN